MAAVAGGSTSLSRYSAWYSMEVPGGESNTSRIAASRVDVPGKSSGPQWMARTVREPGFCADAD